MRRPRGPACARLGACLALLAGGCNQTDSSGLGSPSLSVGDGGGGGREAGASTPDAGAPPPPAPPMAMTPPAAPAPGMGAGPMPFDVQGLLQRRCAGCHDYGDGDPAGWGSVLDLARMIDAGVVVPGDPDGSRMIQRVAVRADMPPEGARLTAAEVEALRGWIAGLVRPLRAAVSDEDVLDAISMDQIRLRNRAADYRYISLVPMRADGRSDLELQATRQVLTLVINSLSRKGKIIDLPAIDDQGAILRLRLADLGWDEALWDALTGFYPYCLRSSAAAHEALYKQLRTEVPVVRGDWLLATATRPPLYERLTDLPATLDQLALRLGLDITRDINHPGLELPDNLVRVGVRKSGEARNNRLVERHLGGQGQYLWITYDFDSNAGRADLLSNPLGPRSRDQQGFTHTFEHAAGQVLFTLPNGLQGYMLVDAAGNRIATARPEIARDPRRRGGAVSETGISCLGCHGAAGVLRPGQTDEVPVYAATHAGQFLAAELDEIGATYPRALRPDVFNLDGIRYRASTAALSPEGPPAGEGEYRAFVDLVGQYESNLGLRGAAVELGESPATLDERLRAAGQPSPEIPRDLATPLLPRDKFLCLYRELAPKLRASAPFCAKSFDAPEVQELCAAP